MKFLRKKFSLRVFSVLSIILTLNSIVYPNISYALTSGPHQPEYTSYEEPGASDMVNLASGDFTYNMPMLSVPIGDEGGFSLPLSYHAGIGPDQEASWVGLGWNINPGSITRNIIGFPDDANSQSQTVTVQDLTGRRGWSASGFGNMLGWDSQSGYGGVIDLTGIGLNTIGFGGGKPITSYGMAGFNLSSGNSGFSVERHMAMNLKALAGTINYLENPIVAVASEIAHEATAANVTPEAGTNGYWAYTKETKKHNFYTDYWIWLDQTRIEDMYGVLNLDKAQTVPNTDPGIFLKIKENINSNSVPVNQFKVTSSTLNQGAASDITTDLSDLSETTHYWDITTPALLAYDNFYVNGPGISGGIKPYRFEVGSVSVPREMSVNHTRLNPVPYMDYGASKVPFVYEGAMGNSYFNHVGASSGTVTSPAFNFGLNSTVLSSSSGTPGPNTNYLQYDINDVVMDNQRIRNDISDKKKLPQGHYVEWLTNMEAKATGGYPNSAFMDYYKPTNRSDMRTNYSLGVGAGFSSGVQSIASNGSFVFDPSANVNDKIAPTDVVHVYGWSGGYTDPSDPQNYVVNNYDGYVKVKKVGTNSILCEGWEGSGPTPGVEYSFTVASQVPTTIPDNSIGGFVITDPSGMNYHFAIPVYDYEFHSETWKKADPGNRNMISRQAPFANTWLLTAITGPDFVDRGGASNTGDGYIDENDWGYWVKFNYYKRNVSNRWSLPFNRQKATSDDLYNTYACGSKEKYFLSSIETRSHVAMFIMQSDRQDGRDATGASFTAAPRLSEIDLITKDTYKTLVNKYKMPDASGSRTVVYNPVNFSSYLYNYLRASALRRILFNQDYSLCNGIPTSSSGKLTLKSLSICGQYDSTAANPNKVFPDYKFEYANNPSYNADKWDGWGMYSSLGTASGKTHQASPYNSDGSAWSLTKVTTPEGSEMNVAYERDTYTSISGQPFPSSDNLAMSGTFSVGQIGQSNPKMNIFVVADASKLRVGDQLGLSGTMSYSCSGSPGSTPFSTQATISDITPYFLGGSVITTSLPYATVNCSNVTNSGVTVSGSASRLIKRGGNIRVSSLTLNDPSGVSYKTQYQYANGTVSIEPDYVKTSDLFFYKYLNYPSTPVLYGQVTVLSGKLTTAADYNTKQVYQFVTPNASQYTINSNNVKFKSLINSYQQKVGGLIVAEFDDYSSVISHQISRHTNRIGKITSQSIYDFNSVNPFSQTNYYYTESPTNNGVGNYQGIFSEGTLLFEAVSDGGANRYHRAQRTTSLTYPYTLQRVVTTTDGYVTTNENKDWDQMTGAVLETRSTSPLGVVTQNITVPAYKQSQYAEFDSKAKNPANKNMLTQSVANYTYRLDNSGNRSGLIGASATTWLKDWQKYRVLDATTNNYINSADASITPIWRTNQSYVWKGSYSRLQPDGTQSFSSGDEFNFASGAANSGWQLTGSKERYNHFSTLIETKDLNGIYSSSKRGYNDLYTIASASNAGYEEIAYSGAEDQVVSNYFGGEVSPGAGMVVSSPTHSGAKALSVSSGYGFVFKSTGLSSNKMYCASAWTNSTDGRLYYKLNGGSEIPSLAPTAATKAGNWYRIDLMIPAGTSFSSLEVGVKSATGAAVFFDDFRFQPAQAAMTSYVYDPVTRNLTYSIGNDNMYTRYEYNGRGIVVKTYSESFKYGGEKLVLEKKDDYKRFHTNQ